MESSRTAENQSFTLCSLCKNPINGEISGCHCYSVEPQIFCRVDHSDEIKQAVAQALAKYKVELTEKVGGLIKEYTGFKSKRRKDKCVCSENGMCLRCATNQLEASDQGQKLAYKRVIALINEDKERK